MEEKKFYYQGKKQVYRTTGSGPTVVLLHGFGEDGTIWRNQYCLFPGYQLIIPDLPGSGKSEMVEDMSMEGLAEVVAAHPDLQLGEAPLPSSPTLLERGQGVRLIGHSMGGYIALAFAEKYPGSVKALGLFHSTAYADSAEKKAARLKAIATINEAGSAAFLQATIPGLFAQRTATEHRQLIAEQILAARNFSGTALVSYYKAMMDRPDRTHVLKTAAIPVLFAMGRWDTAIPLQDGLELCSLPRIAYIHILENSGHTGMLEEPEKANELLTRFITTVQPTA